MLRRFSFLRKVLLDELAGVFCVSRIIVSYNLILSCCGRDLVWPT